MTANTKPPMSHSTGHRIAAFMAGTTGRLLRGIVGIVLIFVGIDGLGGASGWVIAAVGLVPFAAAAANVCLVAPLLHAPFRGRDVLN
jgi:Protein of unknown function (DUF2892)